jgi:prepilin-type N-terminal cleavage/methylation domain-containing protein
MKRYRQSDRTQPAFTLVEIVTAIAIIAILAAILVPAFSLAMKTAMNVKQKGQFNSLNIALEAFRTDFGDYPASYSPTDTLNVYGGAQRLAEAVIGFDGLGFHPRSIFSLYGTSDGIPAHGAPNDNRIYLYPGIDATSREASIKQRKGPYLETETANATKLLDIFGDPKSNADRQNPVLNTFVLNDAFGTVRNKSTNKQTGMPILYYKANPAASQHNPANYNKDQYSDLNIFDLRHNQSIIDFGKPMDNTSNLFPPLSQFFPQPDPKLFYDMTRNPNYYSPQNPQDTTFWRPYRAESFILHSAGSDGLYGTPDDVFNFEPGK